MLMVLKYPNPMHTTSTEEMFRVRERLLMYVMLNSKSVSHARLIQNCYFKYFIPLFYSRSPFLAPDKGQVCLTEVLGNLIINLFRSVLPSISSVVTLSLSPLLSIYYRDIIDQP